ncbi:amine oxidase [Mycobacterium sp. MS1601]|uniref:flavin monoamine oxidase family protein n=1 Tax=Mycobacterium sp. MS1601 TaxID=1936029 RepID=UPI0009794289|nr:FAD-dependent oxidoreductase [Mycobacterium sp. MS1601]AQA02541.1 amine oxidase [Mycobacterium sp. MS1601]
MTTCGPQVVVIGAGIAGLTAAADLVRAGADVTVLEARGRVGGRMRGVPVSGGHFVDGGAAYLGNRHTALLALMRQYGLRRESTDMEGKSTFLLNGERTTTAMRLPPLDAVALGQLFDQIEELLGQAGPDLPWLSPDARRLDRISAQRWFSQRLTHPDALAFLPLFIGQMMAADPTAVSALHMAFYLRSGGGTRFLNAFEGGAQEWRVAGGSHRLCEAMADHLGGRVRLQEPVRCIDQGADGVVVHTISEDGRRSRYRGDRAIVAIPPVLAQGIDFRPALVRPRASAVTGRGCVVKVHLIYPTAVWREFGLSGWSMSARGPLMFTVDDSPPDGSVGVLTAFVTGVAAKAFSVLPVAEQRAAALAHVTRLFPQLPAPTQCSVTDWLSEKYSRGCYAALFGKGDWRRLGPSLTTPHGRIHWAGTETSLEFFGHMEGAVLSGHRAAAELIEHEANDTRRVLA